ncbi:hypothetical protein [Conexibacter sp. DBS9H8]|uniref:hypothetical protein n=1 Tax=Conexibacter sp. DBS9H8 TaxID=2937801 RepID=UPI00201060EF|nr:hypothetical protein [Conexibacter sp. DBS9H8]
MPNRAVLGVVVAVALGAPAVALADGFPPHSNIYMQHRYPKKPTDNVIIAFHRNTNTALIQVNNFCLGSTSYSGSPKYPNPAVVNSTRVRQGKLSYRGVARIYTGTHTSRKVRMTVSAVIKPAQSTGVVSFPGTKCGTIRFVADLVKRTP